MPSPFKLATWNVNSVRARLEHLRIWLQDHSPDVICLQETKVVDEDFPQEEIASMGYQSLFAGQKSYNGVAILAKHPIEDPWIGLDGENGDEQKRLVAGTIHGMRVVNVYVPQGSEVDSPKFAYKLSFLEELAAMLKRDFSVDQPLALVGDINIAPAAKDVVDAEAMANQVSFHPLEHEALRRIMDLGFDDLYRRFSQDGGQYSWWDYRQGSFRQNKGMRIDLLLVTEKLASIAIDCWMDREVRAKEKPSDHIPVVGEFAWPVD